MSAPHNATVLRRQLAAQLRLRRQEAGLSVEEVAQQLLCSPAKISRLENAKRGATLRDVRDLCQLFGLDAEEQERLMEWARLARETTRWQQYDVEEPYAVFLGLEEAAREILFCQGDIVPGLLQTREYASNIIRAVKAGDPIPPDEVDRLVTLRMKRKDVLKAETGPQVTALIDEAALMRPVGGPAVMRGQVEALIAVAERRNVDIRLIPFGVGGHAGLTGRFVIFNFDEDLLDDVAYVEGLVGQWLMEKPVEVRSYRAVFDHLSHKVALGVPESQEVLVRLRDGWASKEATVNH